MASEEDAISMDSDSDDIHEAQARQIVEQLIEEGIVHMPEDDPKLIHHPTGWIFHSNGNLVHFHKGWEKGQQNAR